MTTDEDWTGDVTPTQAISPTAIPTVRLTRPDGSPIPPPPGPTTQAIQAAQVTARQLATRRAAVVQQLAQIDAERAEVLPNLTGLHMAKAADLLAARPSTPQALAECVTQLELAAHAHNQQEAA